MSLKEGPMFGALIIALGVGYLVFLKSNNLAQAVLIGGAVGAADYVLLGLFGRHKK